MRNLKRVLSLTLASVMLLGMMVIGSSAAEAKKINFTDAGDIEYTEAVDVMVALGVIEGTDKGDFNPKGTLTREAAAKIICCMLLGEENANKLTTNTVIFTDVAAGRWSAGYIAYCAQQGILAGTGNGSFNPTGELTGAAFGKMLLVALGYDPSIQGYTGPSWAINVASDMLDAGIDVGGTVLSAPLTREQAAQMAFQSLEADMVDYATRGTVVDLGNGQSVTINASKPEPVGATGNQNYNSATAGSHDETYQQFCEKYFSKLAKVALTNGDELGRPGYTWEVDGAEVDSYAEGAKYVLKDEFSGKTLYNTVGKTATGADYTWAVYEDGVAFTSGNTATMKTAAAGKDGNTKYADNGTITEIYVDTDDEEVTVCIINVYGAEVDKVYTASNVKKDENPYVMVAGMKFETTAFEEDDVVYYTMGRDEDNKKTIVTMDLAEAVEGQVTKVTTNKNFTVNGETYKYNKTLAGGDKLTTSNVKNDVLIYLDGNGYMVFKGEAKTSDDYAYVLSVGSTQDKYSNGKFTYSAKLLLADGTIAKVDLKKPSGWVGDWGAAAGNANSLEHKVVTYTVDDEEYELKGAGNTLAEALNANLKIEKGVASMTLAGASVAANSSTVYLVCNDADEDDYSVFTGFKNVPDINGKASNTKVAYATKNGVAKVVYVEDADADISSDSKMTIIIANKNSTEVKDEDGNYYVFDAVVDGEVVKDGIKVAESSAKIATLIDPDNHEKAYAIKKLTRNSKDYVTDYDVYTTGGDFVVTDTTGIEKADGDVVGYTYNAGTDKYDTHRSYKDDAVVVYRDEDGNLSAGGISMIYTNEDAAVKVVIEKNRILGVFVQEKAHTHTHVYTWETLTAAETDAAGTNHAIGEHKGVCANSDNQCTAEIVYHAAAAKTTFDSDATDHWRVCQNCTQIVVAKASHSYSWDVIADGADAGKHAKLCECGKIDGTAHEASAHTDWKADDATNHWKVDPNSDCDIDTVDKGTHTPSAYRTASNHDTLTDGVHYKDCTSCGRVIEQHDSGDKTDGSCDQTGCS